MTQTTNPTTFAIRIAALRAEFGDAVRVVMCEPDLARACYGDRDITDMLSGQLEAEMTGTLSTEDIVRDVAELIQGPDPDDIEESRTARLIAESEDMVAEVRAALRTSSGVGAARAA